MQSPDHHESILRSFRELVSWVAAGLGITSAMGLINVVIGVLSAAWLATQLWRFWRYDYPELQHKRLTRLAGDRSSERSVQPD